MTVLCLSESDEQTDELIDGVRVIGYPVAKYRGASIRRYLASYARFAIRATAHLTRRVRRYDLIHVHTIPEAMVFCAVAPRLAGRPVLLDVGDLSSEVFSSRTGAAPRPVRWAEAAALRFASEIVTVHEEYRQRVARRAGCDPDDVGVVLNVADDRIFELRSPTPPRPNPTLIYHGLLSERNGLEGALRGVAAARDEVPGVRLEVLGDGEFRDRMVELVDELDLQEAVTISQGSVPVDAIPSRIEQADVGIVPLRIDRFTSAILPTKLIETVRMGRPVIVSRNPVIEHYFPDDSLYYVDSDEETSIATAIREIAASPEDAERRAERAQRFFDAEDWTVNRARFFSIIDRLVPR